MMEALCSSETLVLTTTTWHNILEDGILHSHHCEKLESYKLGHCSKFEHPACDTWKYSIALSNYTCTIAWLWTYISLEACHPTLFYRCTCLHHSAQHGHEVVAHQDVRCLDSAEEQRHVAPRSVCCSGSHPNTDLSWALLGNTIVVPGPEHFKFSLGYKSLTMYDLRSSRR
jgi:hypothetical protein